MNLEIISCEVECNCTVIHSVYMKNTRNLHFCYLGIALGYHVINIEIHRFIKNYFYKKYFLVLSDLQEMTTVTYLCRGWEVTVKTRDSHLLCRDMASPAPSWIHLCVSPTNSS